jgi:hypothetical protein
MIKDKSSNNINDKIVKGLELAYERLVKYKRKINSPLIIEKDGKIIKLDPYEAPDKVKYKRGLE